VQPIIGYYSDHTWTRLGRRRPYFLVGAILASLALIAMPNSSSLWMAAGLLWVLDASVNVSMEPFRAFVGDLMPPAQRQVGFAMQSLLIGLGAVLSSALPWLLTHFGLASGAAAAGTIRNPCTSPSTSAPRCSSAASSDTIITTKENPPAPDAPKAGSPGKAFAEIFAGMKAMPRTMRRLSTRGNSSAWLGLFCMWIYFTPAIARGVFGGTPGSPEYQRGVEWGGVCFATYNGVAFAVAFILVALAQRGVPAKTLHRVGLLCAGAGLLTVGVWPKPELLLISMVGVGIGWATILSMPYALLSNAIPPAKMGFYMGVFNFFIVLPQILAATVLGSVVEHLLGGSALTVVIAGGVCMIIAALALSWVDDAVPAATTPAVS